MTINKHYVGYGLALLALALTGFCWLKAHDAWVRAEATKAGNDAALKANAKTEKEAQSDIAATTKTENQQVQAIQTAAAKPLNQTQVLALIKAMIPHAPVQSVESQGQTFLAVPDTPEARNDIQQTKATCDLCSVKLAARDKDYADAQAIIKARQDDVTRLTAERDQYKTAASKGAGFWHNLKHDAIVGGISFGVGYLLHR